MIEQTFYTADPCRRNCLVEASHIPRRTATMRIIAQARQVVNRPRSARHRPPRPTKRGEAT